MADLAWFSALFTLSCSLPGILSTSQERDKHFGTFSVHVGLMGLELASLEKKDEKKEGERN